MSDINQINQEEIENQEIEENNTEEIVEETVEENETKVMQEAVLENVVEENAEELVQDNQEEVDENQEETAKKQSEKINVIDVQQPTNLEAIVEGLLYIVGEDGAKIEQLASAIEKDIEDTKVILENIQHKYSQETYGIELVGYGSIYKFVSKQGVYEYAQKLLGVSKPNTLSQPALETLAIIAYKQPITRVEIEELRGVGSEMMLRKLQARNLIREVGRSDAPGRPILYEVTEEFMDSFKLYTLNELPDLPEYNKQEEQEELFD